MSNRKRHKFISIYRISSEFLGNINLSLMLTKVSSLWIFPTMVGFGLLGSFMPLH